MEVFTAFVDNWLSESKKNTKKQRNTSFQKRKQDPERTFGWSPSKDDARSLQPTTASTKPTPLLALLPLGVLPGKVWFLANDVKEDDDIGASEDYKESDDNDKEMTIKKPMMTILSPKAPGRLPSYPLFMLPSITHYHYLIGPN